MAKRWCIRVCAFGVCVSTSMAGISLSMIDAIGSDVSCQARGISPDAKFVVGFSDPAGSASGTGFIWDAVNGRRAVVSADGLSATRLTGVGYRNLGGDRQLVLHGLAANGWSTNFFSNDGGATWLNGLSSTGVGSAPVMPESNSMAAAGTDDSWYNTYYDKTAKMFYVEKGEGNPAGITRSPKSVSAVEASIQGVSATGKAVGRRKDATNTYFQNYVLTYNGTAAPIQSYFNGLDGTLRGEAWAVSADGTKVVGVSPSPGETGNWAYYCTNPGAADQTIVRLPTADNFAGTYATNSQAYGISPDGRWVVGFDYTVVSPAKERAVLWDIRTMTEYNLTELATQMGVLGDFTALSRAYAVAVNEQGQPVVVGFGGLRDSGGQTRGFVFTLPEPTAIALLALGGLAMPRRRLTSVS